MTKVRAKRIKRKILFLGLGVSVLCLFGAFVLQFGALIEENYALAECENNIEKLSLDNQELSDDFLRTNHLENLREIAKNLNFEKPEKIHYIKVITGEVAAK